MFLCNYTVFSCYLSVLELKHAIQAKYKIATQHQVLVVNGGECMAAERRVCSYSAGTVSLYAFSRGLSNLLAIKLCQRELCDISKFVLHPVVMASFRSAQCNLIKSNHFYSLFIYRKPTPYSSSTKR